MPDDSLTDSHFLRPLVVTAYNRGMCTRQLSRGFLLVVFVSACNSDSDETRPAKTFPPAMTAAASSGQGGTAAQTAATVTAASSGTGVGGGGGTSASSSSGIGDVCTCAWHITHDDAPACTTCADVARGGVCAAQTAACEADATCPELLEVVLPGCGGAPNLRCLELGLGIGGASRTLAEQLLSCLCNHCASCDVDPKCL